MSKSENIRILSICTSDVSGGAARAAYRLHQGVRSLGVDSRMLVKSKGSKDDTVYALSEFVPNNPIYNALDWCTTKWMNKIQHAQWRPYQETKQQYFLSDLRGIDINRALQTIGYNVLHLHWLNNRFVDICELAKINKPIVWTLHDSWPFCSVCHLPMDCKLYETHCGACPMLGSNKDNDLAYKVFEKKRKIYNELDLHIVTPSRWLAECAKRSALLGRFPISVIPNCIDTKVYQPMNKQEIKEIKEIFALKPDKKYLLFGAMQATKDFNKGFDLLLETLLQLKEIDADLVVYGTDEDLNKYNIPMTIHSIGYVHGDKQMAMLYNAADVVIVPSRSENLSNTIMESMSCGTPVVAFDIGGNGDMIDHQINGYLAKEKDIIDLTKGIEWCLSNNEGNILGRNARKKVLYNYTNKIVAEQYKKLYESLL